MPTTEVGLAVSSAAHLEDPQPSSALKNISCGAFDALRPAEHPPPLWIQGDGVSSVLLFPAVRVQVSPPPMSATCQCTGLLVKEEYPGTELGRSEGMRNCGAPHAVCSGGIDGVCGKVADGAKPGPRDRCTACWQSNKSAMEGYGKGNAEDQRFQRNGRATDSVYVWKPKYLKSTDDRDKPTAEVWNEGRPLHVVGGMGGGGFGGGGGAAGGHADIPGKVVRSCGRELKVTPPAHLCILVQHSYARARTPREHDSL